jgi:hypothetical protein
MDVMSCADVPLLADVIVHFDSLDYMYGKFCKDTTLPLYICHAANCRLQVLNKYYSKTDKCSLYQLSVCEYVNPSCCAADFFSFTVLHPGMQAAYLHLAKWPEDWTKVAILLAIKIYKKHYKPATMVSSGTTPGLTSPFRYSVSCFLSLDHL